MNIMKTIANAVKPVERERSEFTAEVIEALKESEGLPTEAAKGIAEEYAPDIEWSRLFTQSAALCAGRIKRKIEDGIGPLSLNPVEEDEI